MIKDYAEKDRQALIASVTPIDLARSRCSKGFAADIGSQWKPSPVPLLTRWMAQRALQKQTDVFAA